MPKQNFRNTTDFKGGDEYELARVIATPKAQIQFSELMPGVPIEEVIQPLLGTKVRVLADKSPYFIAFAAGLRLVFCVQHRHNPESGRFALVTVQTRN